MTKKPFRILDLFCGAGGCSAGYMMGGADYVLGVDIKKQPNYLYDFVQDDALTFLKKYKTWIQQYFDLIHASPPCQAYSRLRAIHPDNEYPELIESVRAHLANTHLPYVIENVTYKPLINPIMLCGTMFNLRLFRHRHFEIAVATRTLTIPVPKHTKHALLGLKAPKTSRQPIYENGEVHSIYGHFSDVSGARKAMGIDWMVRDELSQAIPPAYTQYILEQILANFYQQ